MPSDNVTITDRHDRRRYEVAVDDELAGVLTYRVDGAAGVITHVHTETNSAYGGRGLGSRLVRFALDDARARGLTVRPQCPFMLSFIQDHPEYSDLVAR